MEADIDQILSLGSLEVEGRLVGASNASFYGRVSLDGVSLPCVYKPVSGERPLWDFPDGTLGRREVAAYLVSEALGWDVVPPTVLRDGPAGLGMVQAWREPDDSQDPVDLVPAGTCPEGYLHVLDAFDQRDRPISLVHEDSVPLRRMAVFDAVVNNADRKGGHVLEMADGHRYGVDHGVTFHTEPKLRTVLWGWAGEPLSDEETEALARLQDALLADLSHALKAHLTAFEIEQTAARCARLLQRGRFPLPHGDWPSIPWPPF